MKSVILLMIVFSSFCFSQDKEIVKILNEELKKELKYQFRHPNFNGDTITLIKEFSIDQNKILSFEIKKTNERGYSLEKQQVPISKIKIIGKDINIILESDEKDVKTIIKHFYKDEKSEEFVSSSEMFFTYIHFPNNEYIGDELIKAFGKAGYKIKKEYWYD